MIVDNWVSLINLLLDLLDVVGAVTDDLLLDVLLPSGALRYPAKHKKNIPLTDDWSQSYEWQVKLLIKKVE